MNKQMSKLRNRLKTVGLSQVEVAERRRVSGPRAEFLRLILWSSSTAQNHCLRVVALIQSLDNLSFSGLMLDPLRRIEPPLDLDKL